MDANILQDEVAAARPDIDERTTQLVSKGRWAVPGYKVRQITTDSLLAIEKNVLIHMQEKFGDLSVL